MANKKVNVFELKKKLNKNIEQLKGKK